MTGNCFKQLRMGTRVCTCLTAKDQRRACERTWTVCGEPRERSHAQAKCLRGPAHMTSL